MSSKTAVIIGAGPAGLTAAYELLTKSDIRPIVLEKSDAMGGLSRTVNYKGNRIDIGGHRFFSKSDRVMNWWLQFLPLEAAAGTALEIHYQNRSRPVVTTHRGPDPDRTDHVMLLRSRTSRILFLRRFFAYPITLSRDTIVKLGLWRTFKIGLSYLRSVLQPIRPERNLEQFFINRFGRELYRTFFQSYTEKVWGLPCDQISAEWGAQRIKGLSILKSIRHALAKVVGRSAQGLAQKGTETSLIERFMYPKLGPGQMWETVADEVRRLGGQIIPHADVRRIATAVDAVTGVVFRDASGQEQSIPADYVFSTMPVKELIEALEAHVPDQVREVAGGLVYRDFITVGLLLDRLTIGAPDVGGRPLIRDNWIYIQEPDVLVGRLQIFNNWSPHLVADASKVWVGMEYFCNDTDRLWRLEDAEMIALAAAELEKIGLCRRNDVIDATVIRVPKTYPAYFGTYSRFDEIRSFLARYANLFLIGRNGMHKYNNQDHSMLTAMTAVENILAGRVDQTNIWEVNSEQDYHEAREARQPEPSRGAHGAPAARAAA